MKTLTLLLLLPVCASLAASPNENLTPREQQIIAAAKLPAPAGMMPAKKVRAGKPAATPPLGWNSYDAFGDNVVESEVLANARYVADKMKAVGWDTVVVDYCWYDPGAHDNNRPGRAGAPLFADANGRLLPATNRFPSALKGAGFKPLARTVHRLGLKFGIHIMRGIPRQTVAANLPIAGSKFTAADAANTNDKCSWCPDMFGVRGNAAGQAWYDSCVKLWASWGVDYIKVDDLSCPYHTAEIEMIRHAIDKSGRAIVFSTSPGETPIVDAEHVAHHANLWRVSPDFWDDWKFLDHEFTTAARWHNFAGPGHWPDADMLPVGHLSVSHRSVGGDRFTKFTRAEQLTLLSFWCLLPAPLMVGANLPDNDDWTLALLTSPEVIAVNQDALGAPAQPQLHVPTTAEVWTRPLADKSVAVGFFNRTNVPLQLAVPWETLGLTNVHTVRDLWLRQDLATDKIFIGELPPHGSLLLMVK